MQKVRYTASPELLMGGDLRGWPLLRNDAAAEALLAGDPSLLVEDGPRAGDTQVRRVTLRPEARQAALDWQNRLATTPALAWSGSGQPHSLAERYRGQPCLLVGSGALRNGQLLQQCLESGIPVIGIGHGITPNERADVWIGSQAPQTYLGASLLRISTACFVPRRYLEQRPLNQDGSPRQVLLRQLPNVWGYATPADFGDSSRLAAFWDTPWVTDGGFNTSLVPAITLAICMGCTEIVFTGVQLRGNRFFGQTTESEALRKQAAYAQFLLDWPEFYEQAQRHGVHFHTADETDLAPVRKWTIADLRGALGYSTSAANALRGGPLVPKQGAAAPAPTPAADTLTLESFSKKMEEMNPALFNTEEGKSALVLYYRERNNGCAKCALEKYMPPLFEAFVQGVLAADALALVAFQVAFPGLTHVLYRAERFPVPLPAAGSPVHVGG